LISFNNEDVVEFEVIETEIIRGALYAVFTGGRGKWKTHRRET